MNLFEYIGKGGMIAYLLLLLNISGFSIMLWKILVFRKFSYECEDVYASIMDTAGQEGLSTTENTVLAVLRNKVRELIEDLERGLDTVRIIATIAPLLGLLGTVVGIVGAFETMASSGVDDPAILADSISLALITTVMGLIVAVPHYVGYNYFISYTDKLESRIEKNTIQRFFEKKLELDMGVWKDAMKNIKV